MFEWLTDFLQREGYTAFMTLLHYLLQSEFMMIGTMVQLGTVSGFSNLPMEY